MPRRKISIVNKQIYHIFNRSTGSIPIFVGKSECQRFLQSMMYYQHSNPPIKYSKYITLPKDERLQLIKVLLENRRLLVEIIAYCIMPTHFHFVVKQIDEDGISKFITKLSSSYSHYFNAKNDRSGSLFGGRFKAKHISTDEQLVHVVRYVHLNPLTSFVVKDFEQLKLYSYSSFPEYLNTTDNKICQKNIVLNLFIDNKHYEKFVADQVDYQQSLERIKYKVLE